MEVHGPWLTLQPRNTEGLSSSATAASKPAPDDDDIGWPLDDDVDEMLGNLTPLRRVSVSPQQPSIRDATPGGFDIFFHAFEVSASKTTKSVAKSLASRGQPDLDRLDTGIGDNVQGGN